MFIKLRSDGVNNIVDKIYQSASTYTWLPKWITMRLYLTMENSFKIAMELVSAESDNFFCKMVVYVSHWKLKLKVWVPQNLLLIF
jgi:hypothetical protein